VSGWCGVKERGCGKKKGVFFSASADFFTVETVVDICAHMHTCIPHISDDILIDKLMVFE